MGTTSVEPGNALTTLNKLIAGENVGQQAVSESNTKKHRDVFGWLLDAYNAGDFAAASIAFKTASDILVRLLETEV